MGTQQDFNHSSTTLGVEEEWQIISNDWWHTSFGSVSWSYQPEEGFSNPGFAKPPHYHRSLLKETSQVALARDDDEWEDSKTSTGWCSPSSELHGYSLVSEKGGDGLNEELIGVKSAQEVIDAYENVVGFDYPSGPNPEMHDRRCREIALPITEVDIALGRERWKASVENLFGDFSLENLLKVKHRRRGDSRSGGKLALAYSNHLARSSTPSKQFRLNPSASTFIPLGSPVSSLSSCSSLSSDTSERISDFTLSNQPLLPNGDIDRRKRIPSHSRSTSETSDYDAKNERPSSAFLPPFLLEQSSTRRKANRSSQTRAIIDRLRSQHHQDSTQSLPSSSPRLSEFGLETTIRRPRSSVSEGDALRNSYDFRPALSSSVIEDERHHQTDGNLDSNSCQDDWTFSTPAYTPMSLDLEVKRNRSRELLRTLRRRTESLPSSTKAAYLPMLGNQTLGAPAPSPITFKAQQRLLSSEPTLDAGAGKYPPRLPNPEDERIEHMRPNEGSSIFDAALPCQMTTVARPEKILNTQMPPAAKTADAESSNALSGQKAHRQLDQNHIQADNRSSCKPHSNDTFNRSYNTFHQKPLKKYPFSGYYAPYAGRAYAFPSIPLAFPVTLQSFSMRGPMPVPVAASTQALQYSTLMHLRVMQQMQQVHLLGNLGGGKVMAGIL